MNRSLEHLDAEGSEGAEGGGRRPDVRLAHRGDRLRLPSLRGRVSFVLTALLALLLLVTALGWVRETRHAIHEEVEAASRVAEQWLNVLVPETLRDDADGPQRLMNHLIAVGRLRANQLEVVGADGALLYVSPQPTYKAGRHAPEWFADQVTPPLMQRIFDAGEWQIRLVPDASRAALDAWDDLVAAMGWAILLLVLVWLATRAALNRALAPLTQINRALERGADGRFDTRLPAYRVRELDLLSCSYNRLAESLDKTRARNARLEEDQAFARALHARLEEERRLIARELHDELGQGITAVRSIAGAIMQRTEEQPRLHGSAQAILAMTGQMQDGVRTILQRLRPVRAGAGVPLDDAVRDYCVLWSSHHPDIHIECQAQPLADPVPDRTAETVMRLLQESLTNVARHAGASRVDIGLRIAGESIELRVSDNGRGLATDTPEGDHYGVVGMRERVDELHGELKLEASASGGLSVCARLPRPSLAKEN